MDLATIRESISQTTEVLHRLARDAAPAVEHAARLLVECVEAGGKILVCGNGGSAADSQHVAAELCVRYCKERRPIPAIALTVDTSILTAASNDLGYENVFARQVEALGRPGDVLLLLSTSGGSPNVIRAAESGRRAGLVTIALTGEGGGELAGKVDHCIRVPDGRTPRIQEAHLVVEHILCEALEEWAAGGER